MRSPGQWLRPTRRTLLRLAGLGAAFVAAVGIGAGIAVMLQGGLYLPGGAEPRQAGDPAQARESLRAGSTTTSIEGARIEDTEGSGSAQVASGEGREASGSPENAEEDPTSDHNIGVWYVEEAQRWAIFNQDLADMPEGTSFDVYVLSDEAAFVHQATVENTVEDGTYLNDPLTNANPDAVLSVTQSWKPGGVGGTYNDHPVGVRYDSDVKQWVIFNEDGEGMPEEAAFNVTIYPLEELAFVLQATSGNATKNWTYIDDPLVNGDTNAILFVVPG